MTKRIRYLVIMALLIGIISMMDNPTTINAEGAYAAYCESNSTDAKCQDFESLKNTKASLADITAKIDDYASSLNEYHLLVADLNHKIEQTATDISTLETKVASLQVNINEQEHAITNKQDDMKNYMRASHATMRLNGYIDFIVNAKDFSDIFRRVEAVKVIRKSNENTINEYRTLVTQLSQDKTEMEQTSLDLKSKQDTYQKELHEATIAQDNINAIMSVLQQEKAHLMIEEEMAVQKVAIAESNFAAITAPSNPGSLGYPLAANYWVSAGTWSYPWGGTHLGVDLAPTNGTVGMPLLAPQNGLVVAYQGGCPTWGGYGSGCNGGYGNYMNLIVTDGTTVYGILYAHLHQNGAVASVGDVVTMGQTVAILGSSGSSTGPHVHAEVYNLGTGTIQSAYQQWNGSNTFGTLSASSGGIQAICEVKGVPCRENPATIWGYQYGNRY
ncbi:murein hydrolase activator EnvC family protein [Erysipelothrix anatis]|uniref:murein hydrolase activator EnvC family protein n=1 Tax=Erysipelothrix anatis TaxID=2683713 RepID=UPI00135A0F08|nr:peptidoglycan DD-metalloendopeptidase family protein [Erysipelothrix anatis]